MKLRLDKFTIAVLAVVGLLLAAAVVTVNRNAGGGETSYRTDNTPETPVVNAFLALQDGDVARAREQYSADVLETVDSSSGYGPLRGETYYGDDSRRLRIIATRSDPNDAERAYVTLVIDNYSTGGPFNSGSTWSMERVVEVTQEEGTWKISTEEFFY